MRRLQEFHNPLVRESDDDAPRFLAEISHPKAARWWQGRVALVGELRLEICPDCGFFEGAVLDADRVPWSETASAPDGVEAARRPCDRCGGGRAVHLSQAFPGHDALRLGWIDTTRLVRSASSVGHVVGTVCPDCGLLTLRLDAPREMPWERLVGFSLTERPCAECGERLGHLEHAGDPTATIATAQTDHLWTEGVGHASAWVCPSCGRIELGLSDCQSLPWNRVFGWRCLAPHRADEISPLTRDSTARMPRVLLGWLGCIGVLGVLAVALWLAMWWFGLMRR